MKLGIFTAIFSLTVALNASGQTTFLERQAEKARQKVVNRVENKIDEGVDKTLDKTEEGIEGSVKKKDKNAKDPKDSGDAMDSIAPGNSTDSRGPGSTANNAKDQATLKAYSKFDFVSGDKVLGFEAYYETSVGDFPLGWNSNGSAEIVTLGSNPEKWLAFKQDGFYAPEFVTNLPENFTLEFDVFTRYRNSNILTYGFDICAVEHPRKNLTVGVYDAKAGFQFEWGGCNATASYKVYEDGQISNQNNDLSSKSLACYGENNEEYAKAHFSIWRQKNRIRIYINDLKIIDVPYGLPTEYVYNLFRFKTYAMNYAAAENDDEFMVSNIRYAVGAPDTRSKLITEGKLVSRGILFNVNSDQIKAESYGTLKEIAKVLQENPTVKVKIIGHTDSDGDTNSNLELSKKRAEAVKLALINEFQIDANRLTTDGKGENEPSDSNDTAVGKANNRRVEFLKL